MVNYSFLFMLILLGCSSSEVEVDMMPEMEEMEDIDIAEKENQAQVTGVTVSGEEGNYTFSVQLTSPDTGCEQYADWWEVIDQEGHLLDRRVLAHSHVNEQPFIRTGSPVNIMSDHLIYVRGHMNTNGYGTVIYAGSIADGLVPGVLEDDFAIEVEDIDPQPSPCAF